MGWVLAVVLDGRGNVMTSIKNFSGMQKMVRFPYAWVIRDRIWSYVFGTHLLKIRFDNLNHARVNSRFSLIG